MVVYSTKWALTLGIVKCEAQMLWRGVPSEHIARVLSPTLLWYAEGDGCLVGEGVQWHRTLADAQRHADDMRNLEVLRLQGAIARLNALDFTRCADVSGTVVFDSLPPAD